MSQLTQPTFASLSDILKYFSNLTEQTVRILSVINNAMFSTDQAINIQLVDSKGTLFNYSVPSFSFISNKLAQIDLNLNKIRNLGSRGNNLPTFSQDVVSEPTPLTNIQVPTSFLTKPNLFFELKR